MVLLIGQLLSRIRDQRLFCVRASSPVRVSLVEHTPRCIPIVPFSPLLSSSLCGAGVVKRTMGGNMISKNARSSRTLGPRKYHLDRKRCRGRATLVRMLKRARVNGGGRRARSRASRRWCRGWWGCGNALTALGVSGDCGGRLQGGSGCCISSVTREPQHSSSL